MDAAVRRSRNTRVAPWAARTVAGAVLGLMVLTAAGCSAGGSGGGTMGAADGDTTSSVGEVAGYADGDQGAPAKDGSVAVPGLATATVLERSVIRTGTARVRVQDVQRAALDAANAARGLGGLVAAEQTMADPQDPARTTSDLTLRVPNDRFNDLLNQVRGLGVVLSQTQQASDVTGQVADIGARVEAQRASVHRIQALLSQADKIGDVVAIESQLAQRQADLESLEAQQRALADQTALATLTVSIVGQDPTGTDEDPTGFMAGLRAGWNAFTDAMQSGLTALGAVLPFVGFFLIIGLPLVAWLRSRDRRGAGPAQLPPPPVREDEPVG